MATFGDIRFRLSKLAQGVDLDLLEGWVNDRYMELLDRLPWQRLDVQSTLQSTAEYTTGTVAATQGSTTVTGTGTAWTSAMTGAMVRIAARNEYYEFTYVSATSGTLERGYEGATGSGLAYRINRNVYALPSDLRLLKGVYSFVLGKQLTKLSLAELNQIDPLRNSYADPLYWCAYMDKQSDPPTPQVELYPVPKALAGFSYEYVADPSGTLTTLLPWLRPAAIIAGVQADIERYRKDFDAADRFENRFVALSRELVAMEAERRGPSRLRVDPRAARHRVKRWTR